MVKEPNTSGYGPIGWIINYCARNQLLTLLVVIAATFWGYKSLVDTPLDAIPDLSDVQVIIYTEWPGRSPDLVEDQITYPLSTTLLAAPKVQSVRGQSYMGLSFVYVIFDEGTDIYWARSRVLEYLNSAQGKLPDDVQPTLGPDATGVGWVFQYALVDKSGNHNLAELRSLQDFKLRYWLESVGGVAELDGEGEVVGGTVVMRYGEDVLGVIERVKQRLTEAQAALPEGVEIITVYDRSELINQAIDTLKHTLTEEMIVVSLIIMVFLLHFRSALIAILTLPVAILLSFIPMSEQNLTANIMSLGGIAVAIGAMVDASIVMIENIHKRLEEWTERNHLDSRTDVIIRIFFMLFINRKSVVESLIILLAVPFSLIGAVWLLAWLDYNLSVAVWVGMLALAGVDTAMGVLMMLYLGMVYRQRQADGRLQTQQDLLEVITEGAGRRIRPMLMTGLALLLGLIPILWSDGTGADVMKRIAAPMVGGMWFFSILFWVLIIAGVVFITKWFLERDRKVVPGVRPE